MPCRQPAGLTRSPPATCPNDSLAVWTFAAGYVLVVLSDVWNRRDKIAVLVVVLPFAAVAWIGGFPDPDVRLQEAVRFGVAAGGLVSGAYLARRLFRPSVARRQAGFAGDAA